MTAEERFAQARPRLMRLAYSELGDVDEAEDVVQEAWLRLERTDVEAIENLDGWLTTVVARLALDRLRSARTRRETYVGPITSSSGLSTSSTQIGRASCRERV